jgi:hypothetical protein
VIDFEAARKIAAGCVREGEMQYTGGPDGILKTSFTPVVVDSQTRELDFGWVFFHDSEEHQKTGDIRSSLVGNVPFIVDRADGSVHFISAAWSVDAYIEEYRRKRSGT